MSKKRLKIGPNEREILKLIGEGILISACFALPNMAQVLKPFFSNASKRQSSKRTLKQLEEKDLIILGGDKIKLTEKGQKLVKNISREDFVLNRDEKWDGVWRIVAYDIPDDFKKERDYFRKKLFEQGFAKVQESLFAFPYDCQEELAVFALSLRITPFVIFLKTDRLPNQTKLKARFDL